MVNPTQPRYIITIQIVPLIMKKKKKLDLILPRNEFTKLKER